MLNITLFENCIFRDQILIKVKVPKKPSEFYTSALSDCAGVVWSDLIEDDSL